MKKIYATIVTAVVGLLASCGSGEDNGNYYVSEQLFASGGIQLQSGYQMSNFYVCPTTPVTGGANADDDDEQAILVDGTLIFGTNTLYVRYSYMVDGESGYVNIDYLDGTAGSSVAILFTESMANLLGLPWDDAYDSASYVTVYGISSVYDFVTGTCKITTEYKTTATSTSTAQVATSWQPYIVQR